MYGRWQANAYEGKNGQEMDNRTRTAVKYGVLSSSCFSVREYRL